MIVASGEDSGLRAPILGPDTTSIMGTQDLRRSIMLVLLSHHDDEKRRWLARLASDLLLARDKHTWFAWRGTCEEERPL